MPEAELACALGVSVETLRRFEMGVEHIGAGRLSMAADKLLVSTPYFFKLPEEDAGSAEIIPFPSSADK